MKSSTRIARLAALGLALVLFGSPVMSAAAGSITPIIVLPRLDLTPPKLSYLAVQPISVEQTSTGTTLVTVTAKFDDASTPVEATATLTPPLSLIRSAAVKAKFATPSIGAKLPPGAPLGCVQAKLYLPAKPRLGTWALSIQASDSRGNTATWLSADLKAAGRPSSITVTAPSTGGGGGTSSDPTPPETYAIGLSDTWTREPASITLEASDGDGSGVKTTYYRLGAAPQQTYTGVPIEVSTPGTTTLAYWSVDVAGNTEEQKTADVRIDPDPPVISHDVKASYTGTATIVLSATDALSGLSTLVYSLDGAAEEYVEVSGSSSAATLTVTANGEHTLAFGFYDLAENVAQTPEALTFTISGGTDAGGGGIEGGDEEQPTAPSITLTGFPPNGVRIVSYATKLTLSGTLARPEGDVAGLIVSLEVMKPEGWERVSGSEFEVLDTGAFSYLLPQATSKRSYRVAFGEEYSLEPVYSSIVTVLPKVRITLATTPKSIRRSAALGIKGTLAPTHAGKPVVVRIEKGTVKSGKTTYRLWKNIPLADPKGAFATSVKFPNTGPWRFSVRVAADSGHAATATTWRTVSVRK